MKIHDLTNSHLMKGRAAQGMCRLGMGLILFLYRTRNVLAAYFFLYAGGGEGGWGWSGVQSIILKLFINYCLSFLLVALSEGLPRLIFVHRDCSSSHRH